MNTLKAAMRAPLKRSPQGIYVLHPGDVGCADEGERLQTLLGSCVSICLSSPKRNVGGMCHIMYSGQPPLAQKYNTAYADAALRKLFADLRVKGVNPLSCDAYVYGGGSMFVAGANGSGKVGERNVVWALDFLAEAGIRIKAKSVGGAHYRKIDWLIGADAPEVRVVSMQGEG